MTHVDTCGDDIARNHPAHEVANVVRPERGARTMTRTVAAGGVYARVCQQSNNVFVCALRVLQHIIIILLLVTIH